MRVCPDVEVTFVAASMEPTNVPFSYRFRAIVGVPELDPFFAQTLIVCVALVVSGSTGSLIAQRDV